MEDLLFYDIRIDYKRIYDYISLGKIQEGLEYVREISKPLIDFNELVGYRLFLNNINYGIYHYILFYYNYSVVNCCYNNTRLMHRDLDAKRFMEVVEEIFTSYDTEIAKLELIKEVPFLIELINHIDRNLIDDLTSDALTKKFFTNDTYIGKAVRKTTGKSLNKYVKEQRVSRAKILLVRTEKTIELISMECGFSSSNYFSTVFSDMVGISPNNYRKAHKKGFPDLSILKEHKHEDYITD